MTRKTPDQLRSARWFAPDDLRSFGHRSRVMQMGYAPEDWKGKPVIAHRQHLVRRQPVPRALQAARRGREARRAAGGRLPDRAAGDRRCRRSIVKPTTMLYRNLLAMETEELLRSHPVDGVVLMGGCDKTTPGLMMGATQRGPAVHLPAGRADAARQLEGQGAGLGLRRLEVLGRAPRRQHLRQGLGRDGGRHRPQLRHLHDHGHGVDDDGASPKRSA